MDSGPVILDISSDEEGWGETRGGGSGRAGDRDSCDWIKVLQELNREKDDSDDVILVSEVIVNPKPKRPAKITDDDDDDDDCVILDGDPDKPISQENNSATGDSDDLVIVGAKGQIACRDFPHPRHLCGNYEFSSTPHEKYCSQCHCYVCDALAPCIHWGKGVSSADHCHATENLIYWKLERNKIKQGNQAPPKPSKITDFFSIVGGEHLSPKTNGPNPVVARLNHPPGFPNSRLHHVIGIRNNTFKRPGGAALTNNRTRVDGQYMRLPSLPESSQPFQSTAFSLPQNSQNFDHRLPFNSQSHVPFANLPPPTTYHVSHSIMDDLPNPILSQPPTSSENPAPFTQPESSNLYHVNSTFDTQAGYKHVNGLKVPHFGSDQDFSSPVYDPCFPNGNGSIPLGLDTDPWMFDQSGCSFSPAPDVIYHPEPPATLDAQLFSSYSFMERPP